MDASGALMTGKLGDDMEVEAGAAAAKTCAISLLAQVKAACGGDLDRLVRVVGIEQRRADGGGVGPGVGIAAG